MHREPHLHEHLLNVVPYKSYSLFQQAPAMRTMLSPMDAGMTRHQSTGWQDAMNEMKGR